ncbi:hypothetical protein BDV26DRAFT_267397 [Aspergillus bertholletiae]|uniref:Uncharacterized protein n=1 Tax=Aspergillus bertholletiae TaxID=1226010 RepID=A0A5N7B0J8_9EURO|nr:hypothetical protein BDV26DRAFT_267397 [Aspergillus bertholletiae]
MVTHLVGGPDTFPSFLSWTMINLTTSVFRLLVAPPWLVVFRGWAVVLLRCYWVRQ